MNPIQAVVQGFQDSIPTSGLRRHIRVSHSGRFWALLSLGSICPRRPHLNAFLSDVNKINSKAFLSPWPQVWCEGEQKTAYWTLSSFCDTTFESLFVDPLKSTQEYGLSWPGEKLYARRMMICQYNHPTISRNIYQYFHLSTRQIHQDISVQHSHAHQPSDHHTRDLGQWPKIEKDYCFGTVVIVIIDVKITKPLVFVAC